MRLWIVLKVFFAALVLATIVSTANAANRTAFPQVVTGDAGARYSKQCCFGPPGVYEYGWWPTPEDAIQALCANYGGFSHATTYPAGQDPVISVLVNCTQTSFLVSASCQSGASFRGGSFWKLQCPITTSTCFDGFTPSYDSQGRYSCGYVGGVVPQLNQGPSCPSCGNPVNPATGNKFLVEDDYLGRGSNPLVFRRYYNSTQLPRYAADYHAMGSLWRHSYQQYIYEHQWAGYYTAFVARPDGRILPFTATSGSLFGPYLPDQFVTDRLERVYIGGVYIWKYTSANGELVETYNSSGFLKSISDRTGFTLQLAYDQYFRLASVTDIFGRALTFSYDSSGRVSALLDPASGLFQYSYDNFNNLASVTYPDGGVRIYHYENASFPNALTGITDENGQRFATYDYDSEKRVISSQHTGGVDSTTFQYGSGTATVTDVLGAVRTYSFANTTGVPRNNGISGSVCPTCGPASSTYYSSDFVQTQTDWNGNITSYIRSDPQGRPDLETRRMEAVGTLQERTISAEWHPTYRLPTRVAEPLRITTMVYGDPSDPNPGNRGNLLSKSIQATSDAIGSQAFSATPIGVPRTWTYTYNANGKILTIDGPRTDVADVTTYSYYANDAACSGASPIGCRGQVQSITNAAGHVTQITEYNAHGQPLSIVDPNGLITTLTYDTRQRLTLRSVGGESTAYTYDNAGQLTRLTLPDGSSLAYTYDTAHRLTQIADSLGNRISYTLDAKGNRTQEQVFDPLNQLAQTRIRAYNNLNRLVQEIGAQTQTTAYGYDNQGNLISIDGPLAGTVDVTTNNYDALNRLIRVIDPNGGQVNYTFNGIDQFTSVSDPRSLVTSYSYDGLNNLNQLVSPDTGTTTNTYDTAGNVITQTDAKGQITSYTYDVLNRVTNITYHGGVTHAYQYDQGANGLGRLTQITEPNGVSQFAYDQRGRLVSEARTIDAVVYVTSYGYDAAGRMAGMTYPSGRQVNYTLDSLGRIQQVSTINDGNVQTVVTNVAYRPFGPPQSFVFGSGHSYTRGFDQDGRIASYTLSNQTIAVGYDLASRISSLADLAIPANTKNYGYDALDRLIQVTTPSIPYAYSYDAVGNRLSSMAGSSTDSYSYGPTSNRLAAVMPNAGPIRNYVHDGNGSVTTDWLNTYSYDTRGRLVQANTPIGAVNYQVNTLGQRIRKTSVLGDTVYHYDTQGRLIAESSISGAVQKEYIYLGDILVGITQ